MKSSNDLTIHLQTKEESKSSIQDSTTPSSIITTSTLSSETIPKSQIPLSTITIHIESLSIYNPLSLASLTSSLNKDGNSKVVLTVSDVHNNSNSGGNENSTVNLKPLHTSIALAGLTPQSESTSEDGKTRSITAIYKPKTNLKSKTASIKTSNKIGSSSSPGAIKINIGDLTDDDDTMINEDDLLSSMPNAINNPEEVDMEKRQKDINDCGGRKACDDCTCGRKEMEEGTSSEKKKLTEIPKSNCGNCSKGDAFRCAGCPYLGKPAFKEGEEHLVLDLTDDL